MLINKDYLKSLSPCEDRYKHYLENYKDWSGSLEQFLDLPELTYDDKRWVFVRSIDKSKLRLVAADFAERVLHIFESKYPNDDRPRKAIEAARNGNAAAADYADYAAAYTADAASAAANAASVAANAASVAAYGADVAAYAAAADYAAAAAARAAAYAAAYGAADAAYAAADAAYCAASRAADACLDEKKAQIEIMKRYAREALKEME